VKYSKWKDEKLAVFYATLLIFFLPFLILISAILYNYIGDKILLDFISFIFTVIQSWNILALSFLTKLFDAKKQTYFIETYKNFVLLLTLIILIILLNNPLPLGHVISIMVMFQLIVTTFLLLTNIPFLRLGKEVYLGYLKYFYSYCKPLYVYLIVSVISVLIGRTILQIINVPEEQSYYALAFKFISVFLIVMGAAVPILTRALSRLNDLIEIKKNTVTSLKMVALFGSAISVLLYIFADNIVLIFGGHEYSKSILVLRFLVFVPILQISNQVLGSFHYSVGLTARYSRAGIMASFLGIFWVVLAYMLDEKQVFVFDAKAVAITYTLNQLGRFILLYRSFKLSNVQGS
jgi:O-antigen/teichoic acid export membrane protein